MLPLTLALSLLGADPTARYESPAGGFSALFPGPVEEQTRTEATPAGPMTAHHFIAQTADLAFIVSFTDQSDAPVTAGEALPRLRAARDAMGAGAKLSDQAELFDKGRPIVHFKLQQDGTVMWVRMQLEGHRFFKVMVVGAPKASNDRAAAVFLSSFQLGARKAASDGG